jgi:hypothetical protein
MLRSWDRSWLILLGLLVLLLGDARSLAGIVLTRIYNQLVIKLPKSCFSLSILLPTSRETFE